MTEQVQTWNVHSSDQIREPAEGFSEILPISDFPGLLKCLPLEQIISSDANQGVTGKIACV